MATGAAPAVPSIPGLDDVGYLTSTSARAVHGPRIGGNRSSDLAESLKLAAQTLTRDVTKLSCWPAWRQPVRGSPTLPRRPAEIVGEPGERLLTRGEAGRPGERSGR